MAATAAETQSPYPDSFARWVQERVGPVVFPEGSSHSWKEFSQFASDVGARCVKTWVGAAKPGEALAKLQTVPYRELIHRFRVVHFNISPAYVIDKYTARTIDPDSLKAVRDEWRDITRFLCRERSSAEQVFLLSVGGELNVYLGTQDAYPDFPVSVYVNACHTAKEEALSEFAEAEHPRVYSVAEIQGDKEFERFARQWTPTFETDLVSLSYYTFYTSVDASLALLEGLVKPDGPFGSHRLMLGEYGPSMESCNWNQASQVRWHDDILHQAFQHKIQFAFFYEIADHEKVIETGSHDGLIRWDQDAKPRLTWKYYSRLFKGRTPKIPKGDVYERRNHSATSSSGELPNFVLSDLSIAEPQKSFCVRVANEGKTVALATTINFYIDDRIVSWVWVPGLDPGQAFTLDSAKQDPRFVWKTQPGKHRMTAVVDPLERVPESEETDNVVTSGFNVLD